MKKSLTVIILALSGATTALAQSKVNVSGIVIERGSNETVPSATVQVLSLPDSSYVSGAATDMNGSFKIQNLKKSKYLLKVSYVGYQSKILPFDLTKSKEKDESLGYITLSADAVLLKEASVTAHAAKVQASGDSLIFNASAYKMAAGSKLEDLVKKLPGVQIDNDGNITVNGKTLSKILVDGKEFFLNDKDMALKNIPTEMIDRIKAYDRKSDMARVTGIDDGEEETVLDLSVKKEMKQGWIGDLDLSLGTESRYSERLNVNRFTDSFNMSVIGSANNVGDRGFGGGGGRGWGGGGNGLRSSKEAGFNFSTFSDKLETGGSIGYRYNGSDVVNESSVQNFVTESGTFNNSKSKSLSSNSSVNFNYRLEWKPDSMTNIIFRPEASYSRSRGFSSSSSVTFNGDPNDLSDDPLSDVVNGGESLSEELQNLIVNTNLSRSQTYSNSRSVSGSLQVNRRLNSDGRNVTVRLTGGLNGSDSKQLSASQIKYNASDRTGDTNNRYYTTPGEGRNYSAQLTYSEPIAKRTYLQFSYKYAYSYTKNDRDAYTFDEGAFEELRNSLVSYRYDISSIIRYMEKKAVSDSIYNRLVDDDLSQFSEYKNYNHTITLQYRMVRDKFNFNVGIDALPQRTKLDYKYMKVDTAIVRNVFNMTPTMDFRYKFSKMEELRFRYRGSTSQPSMTNLLDITDDSDPLNIRKGNPGLKPSFSNDFRLFYNTYNPDRQQGIFSHAYFSMTQNSVANRTSYDKETGVTTTRPENINGNWNAGLFLGFNTALDKNKKFTLNTFTRGGYNNSVSYLDPTQYDEEKSKTRRIEVGENVSLSYRNDWLDVSLNGSFNYNHSKNNVLTTNNLNTYDFSYGAEMQLTLPWGTELNTDISQSSRRGYSQSSMNTNELIWNAQIQHSFLKGNALTLSFEVNDILGQKSNISRTISAMMSSDTRYNSINQYAMFHVIYKINIFGGKNVMGTDRGGFGGPGGGPGGPGRGPGGGRGPR